MVRRLISGELVVPVLLVVITALFVFQYVEHKQRLGENRRRTAENHQLNCAIQKYIEGQFQITASTPQPPNIIAKRLAVITAFEKAVDGACADYKLPSP